MFIKKYHTANSYLFSLKMEYTTSAHDATRAPVSLPVSSSVIICGLRSPDDCITSVMVALVVVASSVVVASVVVVVVVVVVVLGVVVVVALGVVVVVALGVVVVVLVVAVVAKEDD